MSEKIISILGCGWLGFPLGKHLKAKGYFVNGSTTSVEKVELIEKEDILPFLIDIDESPQINEYKIPNLFLSCHCLIVTIPFSRSFIDPYDYFNQVKKIIYYIEKQTCGNVIFTSSTSIYPKNNEVVDEFSEIDLTSKRAKVLSDVEDLFLHNQHFKSTVLRLGGLFGGTRNPGKYLSGKRVRGTGTEPINYIHQQICVDVIAKIIDQGVVNDVFNLVSDEHLSKSDFYTSLANDLESDGPKYSGKQESFKIVSNLKLKQKFKLKSIPLFPNKTEAI